MTVSIREKRFLEIVLLFFILFSPFPSQFTGTGVSMTSLVYNLSYWIVCVPRIALILYFMHATLGLPAFFSHTPFFKTIIRILIVLFSVFSIEFIITKACSLLGLVSEDAPRAFNTNVLPTDSILIVLILITGSSLLTGYLEELFFRDFLITILESLQFPWFAAFLFQAALFSVPHAWQGSIAVIIAASTSTVFYLAFWRWRDIHAIAVAHALHNLAVLCLSLGQG